MSRPIYTIDGSEDGPTVTSHNSTSSTPVIWPEPEKQPMEEQQAAVTPPEVDGHKPWDDFTRHVQIAEWWEENDLGHYPTGWDDMTMYKKKEWLDANVEA